MGGILWDLYWINESKLNDCMKNEDEFDHIVCWLGGLNLERVFMDYHPAEDPDRKDPKKESRAQEKEFKQGLLKLRDDFPHMTHWTNDPERFSFSVYFSPEKEHNLPNDYRIQSLRPVLRERSFRDRFILVDDKMQWYVWKKWRGQLQRVNQEELDNLATDEDRACHIIDRLEDLTAELMTNYGRSAGHGS